MVLNTDNMSSLSPNVDVEEMIWSSVLTDDSPDREIEVMATTFPDQPKQSLVTPAQKSQKGLRLKTEYLASYISEDEASAAMLNEDKHTKQAIDEVAGGKLETKGFATELASTLSGQEFLDGPKKSLLAPAQKSGTIMRLKAKYLASCISEDEESATMLNKDKYAKQMMDEITGITLETEHGEGFAMELASTSIGPELLDQPKKSTVAPAQKSEKGMRLKTDYVYDEQYFERRFRIPRRRRVIVLTGVKILCLAIIFSVLWATGVFNKESSPAEVSGIVGGTVENAPTSGPSDSVADNPTKNPTSSPSDSVVDDPVGPDTDISTAEPTLKPTRPVTYLPGLLTVEENGLLLSQGLTSRIIARNGSKVPYFDGSMSDIPFHSRPDFGATFEVPENATENPGGWVYVSNSEILEEGKGGVGAITFDKDGNVIKYEMLLEGTTANCAGGKTPWETWVSCEEWPYVGEMYQVDPFGRRPAEKLTMSTMQGGRYEAFAYDDRNKTKPRFFATEDQPSGPTRRFTPSPESIDWNNPWDMLHGAGTLEYLILTPDETVQDTGTYEWIDNVNHARQNTKVNYPGSEGLVREDNILYIACKTEKYLYMIDLDSNTYVRTSTMFGLFDGTPDQMQKLVNEIDDIVYFNEDQGVDAGIHGRNAEGQFFTILDAPGWGPETTGLAWDPSGKHMYFALQEDGVLFDITREDGYPFQGMTLGVRYHNQPVS